MPIFYINTKLSKLIIVHQTYLAIELYGAYQFQQQFSRKQLLTKSHRITVFNR